MLYHCTNMRLLRARCAACSKARARAIALALTVGTIGVWFPIWGALALNELAVRILPRAADGGGGFQAFPATLSVGLPGAVVPKANDASAQPEREIQSAVPKAGGMPARDARKTLPITGRIMDAAGRPISGANVHVTAVAKAKTGDLSAWIDAVRRGRLHAADNWLARLPPARLPSGQHSAASDDGGRIRFEGMEAEQILVVTVRSPKTATLSLTVVTRLMEPVDGRGLRIYGADFVASLLPALALSGVVRDAKSHQPITGVDVRPFPLPLRLWEAPSDMSAATDSEGRFTLVGLPAGWQGELLVSPGASQPYFNALVDVPLAVPQGKGAAAVPLDISLHQGIWIRGTVSDADSGLPVEGVSVIYRALAQNPFARDIPGFFTQPGGPVLVNVCDGVGDERRYQTSRDGSYRLLGLPGRGLVTVLLSDTPYVGKGYGAFDERGRLRIYSDANVARTSGAPTSGLPTPVREISPLEGAESVGVDFALTRGASVRLRAVGADGEPIPGADSAFVIPTGRIYTRRQRSAEFDVPALGPSEQRVVLIRHEGLRIGKAIRVRAGDDRHGPVVVRLEPLAAIAGRVTGRDGRPAVAITILTSAQHHPLLALQDVSTDVEGVFKISAVPAGCDYEMQIQAGTWGARGGPAWVLGHGPESVVVHPGRTTDVGEIQFDEDPLH